jgi:UDP-N-acetylglucosamine 2-epimerase
MGIALVVGTRPQIIKTAPILHMAHQKGLDISLIHTGQHYDYQMSQIFLEQFSLPEPVANLNVGSGSHTFQTAETMLRLEKYLSREKFSITLIPGDTNSALAGALTSVKQDVPIAHIEAGARCYDMKMAEEINRRLIDHCSEMLFTPTPNCKRNLEKESVTGSVRLLGDTMFDAFLNFRDRAERCDILDKLDLAKKEYSLLTLHRAENVDNPAKLRSILKAIQETKIKILFPIHPRTRERLKEQDISLDESIIKITDPVGYIEMLKLEKHAKMVLTDSGGAQKEAFWSETPCITIRDRTEWTETVEIGVNFLTGADPDRIIRAIRHVEEEYDQIKNRFGENPFGDGTASEKIVEVLREKFETHTNSHI